MARRHSEEWAGGRGISPSLRCEGIFRADVYAARGLVGGFAGSKG